MTSAPKTEARKKAVIELMKMYSAKTFTQKELCEYLDVTRGTISVLLAEMERLDETIIRDDSQVPYRYLLKKTTTGRIPVPSKFVSAKDGTTFTSEYEDLGDIELPPKVDADIQKRTDQAELDVALAWLDGQTRQRDTSRRLAYEIKWHIKALKDAAGLGEEQAQYEQSQPDPRIRGMQKIVGPPRGDHTAVLTKEEARAVLDLVNAYQSEIAQLKAELDLKDEEMKLLPKPKGHMLRKCESHQWSEHGKLLLVVKKQDWDWRSGDTVLSESGARKREGLLLKCLMRTTTKNAEGGHHYIETWKVRPIEPETTTKSSLVVDLGL